MCNYKCLLVFSCFVVFPTLDALSDDVYSFPKTIHDLPRGEYMQILAQGYEPYKNNKTYYELDIPGTSQDIQELEDQANAENAGSDDTNTWDDTNTTCLALHPGIPRHQKIPLGNPLNYNVTAHASDFCHYRRRTKYYHCGVDMSAPEGTPIYATADAKVDWISNASKDRPCGNGLGLSYANGFKTTFCHMQYPTWLKKGQFVPAGCLVGYVGKTGGARGATLGTTPHLHYQIGYTPKQNESVLTFNTPYGDTISINRCSDNSDHGCKKYWINPAPFVNYTFPSQQ